LWNSWNSWNFNNFELFFLLILQIPGIPRFPRIPEIPGILGIPRILRYFVFKFKTFSYRFWKIHHIPAIFGIPAIPEILGKKGNLVNTCHLVIQGIPGILEKSKIWRQNSWDLVKVFLKSREFREFNKKKQFSSSFFLQKSDDR
jgi:hypothetical protein